jgi:hypothetical protein
MRRFDFKIEFDYLKTEQAVEMAADLLKAFKVPLTKQGSVMLEANLGRLKLAQGDFAALLRRFNAMGLRKRRDLGRSGGRGRLALCTVIDFTDPGASIGPGAHIRPVSLVMLLLIKSMNSSDWSSYEYY